MSDQAPNKPNGDDPNNRKGDDANKPKGGHRYKWQANGGMRSMSREEGLRLLQTLRETAERARSEHEMVHNLRGPYEYHYNGKLPQLSVLKMREEVLKSLATEAEKEFHQCQWDAMFCGVMSSDTLRQIQTQLIGQFQPVVDATARVDAQGANRVSVDLNGIFQGFIQRAANREAQVREAREEALLIVRQEKAEEEEARQALAREAVRREARIARAREAMAVVALPEAAARVAEAREAVFLPREEGEREAVFLTLEEREAVFLTREEEEGEAAEEEDANDETGDVQGNL